MSEIVAIASPCYDFSFKALFEHDDILMAFLNSLFYPQAGNDRDDIKIRDMVKSNSFNNIGEGIKEIYFDISRTCYVGKEGTTRFSLKGAQIFDIEMQRYSNPDYFKRAVFYGSRLFGNQLLVGDGYKSLNDVKVITVLQHGLINPNASVVFSYGLMGRDVDLRTGENIGIARDDEISPVNFIFVQLEKLSGNFSGDGGGSGGGNNCNVKLGDWLTLLNVEKGQTPKPQNHYMFDFDRRNIKDPVVLDAVVKLNMIGKELGYQSDVEKTLRKEFELRSLIASREEEFRQKALRETFKILKGLNIEKKVICERMNVRYFV